ncbi:MAG: hypothetical protein US25_C0017G0003 [Candidatus Moranbacteria bacterium GW2011_GWE1_36_7]|nr:MAG: hypothetical protein US25_C0017G0003 [Candidatus Moranbacteria bacterium GW2011_GWE1_36_7]
MVIVGVVAVVAIIAGVFLTQKNQQKITQDVNQQVISTTDWNTYASGGWGYSIKYPSNLYIKSDTQGDKFPGETTGDERLPKGLATWDGGQTLIISDKEKMGIQDIMPDERIHFVITTFKLTQAREKNQTFESYFKDDKNLSRITMNGFDIYDVINTNSEGGNGVHRYIVKDDWVFDLNGQVYLKNKQISSDDLGMIKKIISTFEFTK